MISIPSSREIVDRYCDEILSGSVVVGELERLAVERYRHDCQQAYWLFDEEAANKAIQFFPRMLRHTTGKWGPTSRKQGDPFELSPWQTFLMWNLTGWKDPQPDPDTGTHLRRFRKAYCSVGRKNGKTTLLAGLTLWHLVANEASPEVYCMGAKLDQSKILYRIATQMIHGSKPLLKRCVVQATGTRCTTNDGVLVPISATSPEHGRNPSVVIFDEMHEYKEENRDTYEAMTSGSMARDEPLHVVITTAGDPGGGSPLWVEEDDYARKVLESAQTEHPIGERMFALVCRMDKGDDFYDPKNFRKSNPNLGVTVPLAALIEQAEECKVRPEQRHKWQRFHANYPVGDVEKVIDMKVWDQAKSDEPDLDGCECFAGLDLGVVYDFAAIALMFPLEDGAYYLKVRTWTCEETNVEVNKEPFRTWANEGFLSVHPGNAIDFGVVRDEILEMFERYQCLGMAFDKKDARVMVGELEAALGFEATEFPQMPSHYSEATKHFVNLRVPQQQILHNGDPCLRWQADNLRIKRNAQGYIMPDRGHATKKIDAMAATIMAFSEALFAENNALDYYENNPIEVG